MAAHPDHLCRLSTEAQVWPALNGGKLFYIPPDTMWAQPIPTHCSSLDPICQDVVLRFPDASQERSVGP